MMASDWLLESTCKSRAHVLAYLSDGLISARIIAHRSVSNMVTDIDMCYRQVKVRHVTHLRSSPVHYYDGIIILFSQIIILPGCQEI